MAQTDYQRRYYQQNRDRLAAIARERYAAKREQILAYGKKWYEDNKERKLEKNREWHETNRERHAELSHQWYEENKDHKNKRRRVTRHIAILRKYGMTEEDYKRMVEYQQNLCAICGNEETCKTKTGERRKKLCLDHNHKTMKARGLLCNKCNALLGQALDDTEILQSAIDYLNWHNGIS